MHGNTTSQKTCHGIVFCGDGDNTLGAPKRTDQLVAKIAVPTAGAVRDVMQTGLRDGIACRGCAGGLRGLRGAAAEPAGLNRLQLAHDDDDTAAGVDRTSMYSVFVLVIVPAVL